MIGWLRNNFPVGHHYLVQQEQKEQINAILTEQLVSPFQSGRKHNLWGAAAKKLPLIGKKLGWVPNKIPATFLNGTVEAEIADAVGAAENYFEPLPRHFQLAQQLLSRFDLSHLAAQNPLFLSEGETKILWFLTQWVKKPEYLVIGYLPAALSTYRITEMVNFIIDQESNSPTLVLGFQPDDAGWYAPLLSHSDWKIISERSWHSNLTTGRSDVKSDQQ